MLTQGIEPWSAGAIHDTVGALLRDPAYQRSFWSSLAGRLLTELGRFVLWFLDLLRGIPGGSTTVLTILALVLVVVGLRIYLAAGPSDSFLLRRRGAIALMARADPWNEAERLAGLGDYMGAAHALYQAVLRRLSASERIRVHASKTSGDYARELRRRGSPAASAFQRFGRRFDRIVFGAGTCTADDFAALRKDAVDIPERQAAA